MRFRVIDATPDDGPELIELLPRLGAFPRPEHRRDDAIHRPDEPVIRRWIDGSEPGISIVIARDDDDGRLVGLAMVSLQADPFTGEPSAHLESLAVGDGAEGRGVGSALIERAEQIATERGGARTMTLHVFQSNERAIALYERNGYRPEWVRYIKRL